MEPVTLSSLWIIVGIVLASGSVVVSAFSLFNTTNDRISKLDVRVGRLENTSTNASAQTSELMDTVKDIQESIADIKITQTELRVVLSGVDGKNGLRGEFRELKAQLKELLNKM